MLNACLASIDQHDHAGACVSCFFTGAEQDMYHGYDSRGEPSLRVTVSVVVHRVPKPENMKF